MDYLNVKLDSYEYKILSDKDKLKVVKTKLNDLFENKKGKVVTTVYNGKKKDIPYWAIGTFKDLNNREKALLKKVNIDFEYDFQKRRKKAIIDNILRGFPIIDRPKDNIIFELPTVEQPRDDINFELPTIEQPRDDIDFDLSFLENQKKEGLVLKQEEENLLSVWIDFFNKKKTSEKEESYGLLNINDVFRNINEGKEEFAVPIIKKSSKEGKTEENDNRYRGKTNKHNNKKGFLGSISSFPVIRRISDRIKNKNKVKNILEEKNSKKCNIKVAAVALGLIVTTMIGSFVPGMFKKKNNSNRGNVKSTSYVEDVTEKSTIEDEVIYTNNNTNETENVVETDINIIETENVIETKETNDDIETNTGIDEIDEGNNTKETENNNNVDVNNSDNYTISFDDKVTINDNSYIYGSSYDAAGEKNGVTPLFDCSYERDVMGVVYNLDGNIYTIYSSDSHAYEKADELISKGAKEKAVLVTRSDLVYTGQYEGYYDIDDVNVKTLTKNR